MKVAIRPISIACSWARLGQAAVLGAALSLTACGPGWALKGSETAAEAKKKSIPWPEERTSAVPLQKATAANAVFLLDGKPLCFVGTNNYYLTFKSQQMVDDVFDTAKDMGLKVLRQWAMLDRGSIDGSVPSVDGDGTKEHVYFQYWDTDNQRPAYNDGPDGLERLDYVLYKARQNDIRVVLVLINNWQAFGGVDQYLTWYGLKRHHEFFTDERVKQAYKDYVTHLANRVNKYTGVAYKDDPYVFSWGLMNEPRMRNYTSFDDTEGWDPKAVTNWVAEMSDYVRSIDPNHMISVGDEGFYQDRSGGLYSGEDGVNHDAMIALENVDYATFHLYPDHWGQGMLWGDQWIEDHIVSARKVGKPTVLEEYGIMVKRDEKTQAVIWGAERREKNLKRWQELFALRGGAGAMFWMLAGWDDYLKTYYKDYDHFTVYSPKVDPTGRLMKEYAARMSSGAQACEKAAAAPELLEPKRQVPAGFVTTSKPEVVLRLNLAAEAPAVGAVPSVVDTPGVVAAPAAVEAQAGSEAPAGTAAVTATPAPAAVPTATPTVDSPPVAAPGKPAPAPEGAAQ